jgi:hypothetical protein
MSAAVVTPGYASTASSRHFKTLSSTLTPLLRSPAFGARPQQPSILSTTVLRGGPGPYIASGGDGGRENGPRERVESQKNRVFATKRQKGL